jgi:hypothetical protein
MSGGISPVAGHYRPFPGSMIGRAIAYYHVRFSDLRDGDSKLDVAHFQTAVRAIQQNVEIMWISVPYVSNSYGAFQIAVSYDTANVSPQNGNDIQAALRAALDDGNIEFRREYLVGSNWYTEDDFLSYCDANYAKDANGTPIVFSGVEQDEFAVKYMIWNS